MSATHAFTQCVAPDFTLPATACLEQRVTFTPAANHTSYDWDFCSGDLLQSPTTSVLSSDFGGYGHKVELAEQGGSYYGFILGRANKKLYRYFFGANVNDAPLITEVGGLGKNSDTWRSIDIVKEGTDYIGFFIDGNGVYRVNFGNDLTSTPTSFQTIFEGDPINFALDLVAVQEGNSRYLFVASFNNEKLTRIKFNNAFNAATPDITVDAVTVSGSGLLSGISFIKDCDKWYSIASSVGTSRVFKIAFDDGLDDTTPTINNYDVPGSAPAGISVVNENSQFIVFAQSQNAAASLFRINFGSTLSNNPQTTDQLDIFGVNGLGLWGFSMYKVGSTWLTMSAQNSGSNLYRITFPNNCFSTTMVSNESKPVIETTQSGNFFVTLGVTDGAGIRTSVTKALTVSASTSPDIDFSFNGICAAHDVDFISENTSGDITGYDWQFGDAGSASIENPTHQYAVGSYNVDLTVTASSTGCVNAVSHPIKIYPQPTADFQAPAGLVCTNNDFEFTTLTTDVYEGNLVYNWFVDGDLKATSRDLTHAFTTTGDKIVKLNLSIPGCFDDEEKQLTGVLSGPEVSYTIEGRCEDVEIRFVNGSVGSVASYQWDFGNGESSGSTNATSQYANAGLYEVVLNATGTNGCVTSKRQDLTVYSKPAPALSLDLPPFSCAGSPSQFHDGTPPLTDSNVNQWNWNFGDSQSGTTKDPTHVYSTAGDYNVQFTVTTDKGCSASTAQQVSIAPSPTAAFTVDPTCLNKATRFISNSTGNIASYQWRIGNQVYTVGNPAHTFAATGNFSAQLKVIGTNSCESTITKSIVVPVVPTLDFTVTNPCSGQATVFTDITSSPADPIAQRLWTFAVGATANTQQSEFTFAGSGTYPVKLDITNQSGCVYTLNRTVAINTSPVANFTMSRESGPPPLSVSFTNTSTGASTYEWDFSDGNIKTGPSQEYTYNALGDYNITLTATSPQGCSREVTKSVSVIIPFNELSLEEFSLVPSGTTYRGYVRVHNKGNYRIDGFSVTYDVGGGLLVTENVTASLEKGQTSMILLSNVFTNPATTGYICAELQSDADISDNKACAAFNDTSVILNPYPNPVDTHLTVETIQPAAGTVRIALYNTWGGNAYDRTFDVGPGLSRLVLDVQNLSSGIYIALITSGGTTSSRKIIIHR